MAAVYGSQVKISHEKDASNEYTKCGKQGGNSFKQRPPSSNKSGNFSETRTEKAWNKYYSSLNGSEAAMNSFR